MDFVRGVGFTPAQVEAMARALYAVALFDGLVPGEEALIARFCAAAGGRPGLAEELARLPPADLDALAAALPEPSHRRLFLKAALVLARADGVVSPRENAYLLQVVLGLGLHLQDLEPLEREADEYLDRAR